MPITERQRQQMREWQKNHPDYNRNYVRTHKEQRKATNKKYRSTHKKQENEYHKKFAKEHPEIVEARHSARNHIPLGSCCELCGSTENLERHHPDYTLPKFVLTLCGKCARKIHKWHREHPNDTWSKILEESKVT